MKVHIYYYRHPAHINPDHDAVLDAFREGLDRLRISSRSFAFEDKLTDEVPDFSVMFGTYKHALPWTIRRKELMDRQSEAGKRTVVIDSGYLRRDKYYMVGLDGLNGRADFRIEDPMPPDRWEKLGLELKPWPKSSEGRYILVCGQVPWDASVQATGHVDWLQKTVNKLGKITSRTIIFSRHPLGPKDIRIGGALNVNVPSLGLWLGNCHATVCYSSNSGVESLIAGIPTFSFDQGSMVYEQSLHDLEKIEEPYFPEREQWAHNLAYCQWNIDEMKSGEAQKHILEVL